MPLRIGGFWIEDEDAKSWLAREERAGSTDF